MTALAPAFRFAISLLAISAWLAASNHCAIGEAVLPSIAQAPSHPGCSGHRPSQDDGKSNETECCKTFPPASFTSGKNLVIYDGNLFALQLYFVSAILAPVHLTLKLRPLELDTGPPFARSFVESVLQRSILAHAPPIS